MGDLAGALKKSNHFSSRAEQAKGPYFVEQQMLRFLGPEFILFIKNIFRERRVQFLAVEYLAGLWAIWVICWWFVGGLDGLQVICGWFGWIVSGLDGLWVASSFTANASVAHLRTAASVR